jgi:hypothetical protein
MRGFVCTGLLLAGLAMPAAAAAADPPVLAAAGDIACQPPWVKDATHCHHMETSDLVISRSPDAVATLGDNQYAQGKLTEYNASFDASWGRFKGLIHPAPGNHDYQGDGFAAGYYAYFGSAAGDPAKGYYSWDLGSWHLVALNSDCSDGNVCDNAARVSSAEVAWLQADLAANPTSCTLAYWHHPLFGDGNGGDNTVVKPLWQALYSSGADIVLNGHDHSYQRWAQQDPDGAGDADGLTQIVAGTGGKDLTALNQQRALDTVQDVTHFGVLFLTLSPARADWEWRGEDGTVLDSGGVWCHRPEAKATITPAAPTAGTQTDFDAGATTDHYGKALTTYVWDFGDGTAKDSGVKASHAYAAAGTYTVTLTVTNARGLKGITKRTVDVRPPPPPPDVAGPGSGSGTASPGGTTDPGTTSEAAAADPVAPVLTLARPLRLFEVGMTRRAFRRGSRTAFRYRLTADAQVRILIQRRRGTRWVTLASFSRDVRAGRVNAPFDGRVRGRLLPAGGYRAAITAVGPDGRRTTTSTVVFRIGLRRAHTILP